MPSDFSRDFMAGASVARMAQQRQERMIELRAQAARDALMERQIVQELEIKTQQFKQQQEMKSHLESVFAAADDTYNQLAPEIGEEAAKEFIDRGIQYDPIAGPVLMKIRESESQMRMNQAHAKAYEASAENRGTTAHQQFLEDLDKQRFELEKQREQRLQENEKRAMERETGRLTDAQQSHLNSLHTELRGVNTGLLKLEESLSKASDEDERSNLTDQANRLLNQKKKILKDISAYGARKTIGQPQKIQPMEQKKFEVGKIYKDSKGNRARYTENGTWEKVD